MFETKVSFYTAKLAKSKGYPQNPTKLRNDYYNYKGELNGDCTDYIKEYIMCKTLTVDADESKLNVAAPTQSNLLNWLRKTHDIHVQIMMHSWVNRTYAYRIHTKNDYVKDSSLLLLDPVVGDYESVFEKALQHGLMLV